MKRKYTDRKLLWCWVSWYYANWFQCLAVLNQIFEFMEMIKPHHWIHSHTISFSSWNSELNHLSNNMMFTCFQNSTIWWKFEKILDRNVGYNFQLCFENVAMNQTLTIKVKVFMQQWSDFAFYFPCFVEIHFSTDHEISNMQLWFVLL